MRILTLNCVRRTQYRVSNYGSFAGMRERLVAAVVASTCVLAAVVATTVVVTAIVVTALVVSAILVPSLLVSAIVDPSIVVPAIVFPNILVQVVFVPAIEVTDKVAPGTALVAHVTAVMVVPALVTDRSTEARQHSLSRLLLLGGHLCIAGG